MLVPADDRGVTNPGGIVVRELVTGLLAGSAMGLVLFRGQLCFHSLFRSAWAGQAPLLRSWALGVGLGTVGLSLLYLLPWSAGLNTGLPFRPVGNVAGGLLIGVGMVVAQSCASGLFYRLGSGALGSLAGIAGWAVGEYAASRVDLRGPTVLSGGAEGTVPGVLGLPRLLVSLVVLAGVLAWLARTRRRATSSSPAVPHWQWTDARLGVTVGVALVIGWVLARLGGASFGPSTVGAVAGAAAGRPAWWLTAFLVGLVLGAAAGAGTGPGVRPRGERGPRLAGLAGGGFLLGAGGWIAGGCNLGHGLSGLAQLDVASVVAVLAMALGVGTAGAVRDR